MKEAMNQKEQNDLQWKYFNEKEQTALPNV
jgi:hypothetical protein